MTITTINMKVATEELNKFSNQIDRIKKETFIPIRYELNMVCNVLDIDDITLHRKVNTGIIVQAKRSISIKCFLR